MWLASGTSLRAVLLLCLTTGTASAAPDLIPLELREIPVNGNDVVEDPEAVTAKYGFTTRTGSKIVEHGDSITLLDSVAAIETPHVKWATPHANGPVRVLFITSQAYGARNPVELRQRSDFEITVLRLPGVLNDAKPDRQPVVHRFYWDRFEKLLAMEYDVIFLADGDLEGGYKDFDNIKDRMLRWIKDKVGAGCGLVLLHGNPRWYRLSKERLSWLRELSPLTHGHGGTEGRPSRTDASSPVSESFSFALWPPVRTNQGVKADDDAQVLAEVGGKPVVATGQYGKGRVVAAYYRIKRINVGLIPENDPEKVELFGDYYEPVYAFYLKGLAWAARREPRVRLGVPEATVCKSGESPNVAVHMSCTTEGAFTLRYHLRDELGGLVVSRAMDVEVGSEDAVLRIQLPSVYANGLYRLDLWLTNKQGGVENWGSTAVRIEGGPAFSVGPMQKEGKLGGTARYRIRADGVGGTLYVSAVDDMDRIFFEQSASAEDGAVVEVDLSRSCLPHNRVEFTLRRGDRVLARQARLLYIPRIGLRSMEGEYMLASYGCTLCEAHLARFMGAVYREAGLNTIYLNWHNRKYIRGRAADLGLFNITGASWSMRQFNLKKELKLSPNKPEVRADFEKKVAQAVDDVQTYGGVGRVLDDETWFAYTKYEKGEMRGAQADQSAPSLKLFREAMASRYQTIGRLNYSWDTRFESFEKLLPLEEDVVRGLAPPPYPWDEAKDGKPAFVRNDNPSGWMEFRQYMNWTFAHRYYGWITELHQKELGRDYGAGCGAPFWAWKGNPTYRGGDMAEMKKAIQFMMLYGGSSESYPTAFVGQPGAQKYDPPLNWRQFGPWYHLFTGADALWFYLGHAMVGSEIAWRRHAEWLREGIEDIRNGVGALIRDAEPLNRQVRTLYSAENLAMQWLFAKRKDAWQALRKDRTTPTLTKVIDEQFVRSTPVTAEDVRSGDLKDCKLLILPTAFCMDEATSKAIREYVHSGGCVVADLLPATRTRFGKPRTEGLLHDVFGVNANAAELHQEPEVWFSAGVGYAGKLKKDGVNTGEMTLTRELIWLPADVWQRGLLATTAKPEAALLSKRGKESYGCYVNAYGKGKALLLNFVYCDYSLENAGWHHAFGKSLAQWAGLQPSARILKCTTNVPLPYPLFAFRRGAALLLASVRGRLQWVGQRPKLLDETRSANFDDQVKFAWPEKRHAYNVRTGKYLGETTEAEVDLPSFHGRLLALLPYKVEAVKVSMPSTWQAGRPLTLSAQIQTSGAAGEHVLRLEVHSPTGYRNLLYCKTRTARAGRADFTIPFANNDRKGPWRIIVRDVMSGVAGDVTVVLR